MRRSPSQSQRWWLAGLVEGFRVTAGSDAMEVLAGLVLDDGRRWASAATPWQLNDARAVLDPADGDPRLHWLGRPKGGSKTTDLSGMSIAWLVTQAPPMTEGFAVASDEEQANRLLDRARGFISRTKGLDTLKVEARRIVNLATGARVQALAADVASSEGLLTPWIVVDELPNWTQTPTAKGMFTSIVSTIPKWPGMRLVVIGHAGSPSHWSHAVLEGARKSPAWRVTEIPGPLSWVPSEVLDEQRRLLLPSEFERRHMNRWVASEDRLATLDDVRACIGHSGILTAEPGRRYVQALDIGFRRDNTALVVCHLEDRSKVVVDRLDVLSPKAGAPVSFPEIKAMVLLNHKLYNRPPLIYDLHQAAEMTEDFRARGMRTIEAKQSDTEISHRAKTLFNALTEHNLDLPDDADLIDEMANVELRETRSGRYRIDHGHGKHDDRVVAISMAVDYLVSRPRAPEPASPISSDRPNPFSHMWTEPNGPFGPNPFNDF